ncbi:hypothetical protein QOZ80_2BG0181740 [Eleusine coracana subsp. coracana]|nr:hypothetical protein QOZ80_2BG0181740 [Eleusine coracana subsp. coracana]
MDDDAMEMQLLLMGPTNEENLGECLGGIIPHNTHHLMVYDLEGCATQTLTDEIQDYLEPSMLGCFTSPWRCSQRRTRKRGKSWGVEINHLFGVQNTIKTGGEKYRSRKNNSHWTEEEMTELVIGVSEKGDKWRNLVKACRTKVGSKKKVNKLQKATELIVQRFKRQILDIAKKHDDDHQMK